MAAVVSEDTQVLGELENAYKTYNGKNAVDGLSLTISSGRLLALLGPNGAGKTTTISMMLGLQRPDAGSVQLFGGAPDDYEVRRNIGVMLQEEALAGELKVKELLEWASAYYPNPYSPDEVMRLTNTTGLAERRYSKLSGGQKRLVQFAIAICGRPNLMFLDEPTTGLDVDARETLWATIREFVGRGTAVILTTHYLEEAEALADEVVVIVDGREAASGTVDQIRGLVERKRITCRTSIDPEQLRSWPGVLDITVVAGRVVTLIVNDVDEVARRLLVEDPTASEMEIHRAGLNEAFKELTKESLQ